MRTWIPVVLLAAAAALSGCSQLGEPETTPNPDGSKTCIDRKCIDVTMRPGKECTEDGKRPIFLTIVNHSADARILYKITERPNFQYRDSDETDDGEVGPKDGKEIAVIPKDMSIDVSYKLQLKRPDGQLVSGEFFQGLNPRACP